MGYMSYDPRKPLAKYLEDYKRCRTCRHSGALSGGLHDTTILVPCFYIIDTGKPRPCAPGKQCTVYDPIDPSQATTARGIGAKPHITSEDGEGWKPTFGWRKWKDKEAEDE